MSATPPALAPAPLTAPGSLSPLARVLRCAASLPSPPPIVADVLTARIQPPAGVLAALDADGNLRGAVMAAIRLRHGAVPGLAATWVRLGNTLMIGHVLDAALVLYFQRLPMPLVPDARHRRWRNAFAVAGAMRALAERERPADAAQAQVAGALHILGEVAIEQTLRLVSPSVSTRVALGEVGLAEVESALRLSRFQVAGAMLALRGYPTELWQGVARQRDPSAHPLAGLLATARRCAAAAGHGPDATVPMVDREDRPIVAAAADAVVRMERLRRVLCGS
ncbi:MAG: HDOD domain-containing protein [Myxococcales bacterium]|nr:HDOD domain-containing protein [Myxococcales bacterium]